MKLSSGARNELPAKSFVFPKERKFPIEDKNHARNALSRAGAKGGSTEAKVDVAVHRKYPDIGADHRIGRLSDVKTDRGDFRFKANRKGE